MNDNKPNTLSIWTVYDHPADYPDVYIARRFELDKPTDDIIISTDLQAVRDKMEAMGLWCISRHPFDDVKIVETWV